MDNYPTKSVKYLREIITPEQYAGQVGDKKELPGQEADRLAAEGYVEIVGKEQPADDSTSGKDSGGE